MLPYPQDIILAQAQRPLGDFKFSDIFLYMAPVNDVCTDATYVSVTSAVRVYCLLCVLGACAV